MHNGTLFLLFAKKTMRDLWRTKRPMQTRCFRLDKWISI